MLWATSPRAPRRLVPLIALGVVAPLVLGACTRTRDLAAHVKLDASTTTLRIPVNRLPRRATTTTVAEDPADSTTTTTTVEVAEAAPAAIAATDTDVGGLSGLAALVSSVQRAAAKGAATTTTRPIATPPTSVAPTPATTTTVLPTPADTVIVTAMNAKVHPGETQFIDVFVEGNRVALQTCSGRDYRFSADGWVAAGFTTIADCPTSDAGPRLVRTVPSNITPGPYAFCTEIATEAHSTVCAPYIVVAYPT